MPIEACNPMVCPNQHTLAGAAGVAAAVVFGISFAAITLGFHEVPPGSSAVQTANAQATACAQEKAPDRRGPNTGTGVAVGPWAGLWQTPGAVPMTALWALMVRQRRPYFDLILTLFSFVGYHFALILLLLFLSYARPHPARTHLHPDACSVLIGACDPMS